MRFFVWGSIKTGIKHRGWINKRREEWKGPDGLLFKQRARTVAVGRINSVVIQLSDSKARSVSRQSVR
jgi:hypothetical protein